MEAVRSGAITGEDLRISRDMLLCQADVAESAGKSRWPKTSAGRQK